MFTLIRILIFIILLTGTSFADNPPETIYDEGVRKGTAFNINCVGAGIACTQSGITGTITVSGGGSGGTVNSGLINYLAKYPATGTTVDDSAVIMDNGTNVGVGTVSPTALLNVWANANDTGIDINSQGTVNGCDGNTVLLMHNDENTLMDVNCAGSPNPVVLVGSAAYSTVQKKFGTGSALFTSNGDHVTVGNSANFNFGSGNFTIDAWIYQTSNPTVSGRIWQSDETNTTNNILLDINSSGQLEASFNASAWTVGGTAPCAITNNTLTHAALEKFGSLYTLFINGNSCATTSNATAITDQATTRAIGGVSGGTDRNFFGYIDEIRVSNVARYSGSNFTPASVAYTGAVAQPRIKFQSAGTTEFTIGSDGNDSNKLKIGTTAINTNTRMTIDSTGNVGLGTTVPGQILDINGVLRTSAGSAALPSVVGLTGNNTTGLWYPAANTLAASTNALERVRIDSSGNFGISTTLPGVKFDVNGTGRINGTANAVFPGLLVNGSSNVGIGTDFTGGTAGRLAINGNVGIQVPGGGPNFPLQIGTGTLNGQMSLGGTTTTFTSLRSSGASVQGMNTYGKYTGSGDNNVVYAKAASSGGAAAWVLGTTGDFRTLTFYSEPGTPGVDDQVNVGPYQKFQIDTNGNVGIGSSLTSTALLQVASQRPVTLFRVDNLAAGSNNAFLIDQNLNVGIGTTITGNAGFSVMNGNVGIGTWKPGDYFQIGTNSGFRVSQTGSITALANTTLANLNSSTLNMTNGGGNVIVQNNNGTSASNTLIRGGTAANSAVELRSTGGTGTSDFIRFTVGSNGATEAARFDTSGNLGIGTINPTGKFVVSTSGTIGWSVKAGANTACSTTCGTTGCVFGEDTSVLGSFVDCADATADRCVCAGP